jgi:hypothetical protein
MRTTLNLDADVFAAARARAQRERLSLGEAVSRLVRDGLQATAQDRLSPGAPPRSRYTVLPARDEIITSEHVYHLMEQEGI